MDMPKIIVTEVETAEGRANVQYLYKTIWGINEDLLIIPGHILLAIQRANGLALCAYCGGKPVGFSFGFLGLTDEREIYYWDHLIGILEDYRDLGIGYMIKMKQREIMLDRGVGLAMWTFEPLESRAAYLNFKKLGCVCKKYVRDYYGTMFGLINKGIPSDRLVVEWRMECPPHPGNSSSNQNQIPRSHVLNKMITDELGVPKPKKTNSDIMRLLRKKETVYIEIPSNYQEIRKTDMLTVLEWRFAIRYLMETCFKLGARIVGFIHTDNKSYYVLKKMGK